MHAIVSNGVDQIPFLFSVPKSQKYNFALNPSWQCYVRKSSEDIAPQCRQILQTFVWWGPATNLLSPLPTLHIQTSVNFGNFTEPYL